MRLEHREIALARRVLNDDVKHVGSQRVYLPRSHKPGMQGSHEGRKGWKEGGTEEETRKGRWVGGTE